MRIASIVVASFLLGSEVFAGSFRSEGNQNNNRPKPTIPAGWVSGTVAKVIDGDTIHVTPEGKKGNLKIRMVGIDTAELHLQTDKGMESQGWWAEEGTRSLERLAPVGARVKVYVHGGDNYGRALGHVYDLRDHDVNLEQVETGWAAMYLICGANDCTDDFFVAHKVDEYVHACQNAVQQHLGIFNERDPLRELPFLFRLRMQKRQPDKYVGNMRTHELYEPAQYDSVPLCDRVFFPSRERALEMGFIPAR